MLLSCVNLLLSLVAGLHRHSLPLSATVAALGFRVHYHLRVEKIDGMLPAHSIHSYMRPRCIRC